jgi:hypothetical protein
MAARLPILDDDDRLIEPIDPARRFLPVRAFAQLVSISERSAWRLIAAGNPRLEVVRLGRLVRVRLRDSRVSGTSWQ